MIVPMMRVWEMVMRVSDRLVAVSMRMPRAGRDRWIVFMLVMAVRVMDMLVIVFQCFVDMIVLVTFCQVQPYAERHQRRCRQQLRCQCVAQ
jgi:hypothetical protein